MTETNKKAWKTKRVFESPVDVGDEIHFVDFTYKQIYNDIVQMVGFTRAGIRVRGRHNKAYNKDYMFGKNAFLTRKEAIEVLQANK